MMTNTYEWECRYLTAAAICLKILIRLLNSYLSSILVCILSIFSPYLLTPILFILRLWNRHFLMTSAKVQDTLSMTMKNEGEPGSPPVDSRLTMFGCESLARKWASMVRSTSPDILVDRLRSYLSVFMAYEFSPADDSWDASEDLRL